MSDSGELGGAVGGQVGADGRSKKGDILVGVDHGNSEPVGIVVEAKDRKLSFQKAKSLKST